MNKMIYILPLALAATACSHKSAPAADDAAAGNPPTVVRANPAVIGYRGGPAGKGSKAIPKATAFRMSGDYADAVRCGANMVRVGSAIFGARNYQK